MRAVRGGGVITLYLPPLNSAESITFMLLMEDKYKQQIIFLSENNEKNKIEV